MFAAIIGIRTNAKSGSQPTEAPRPKRRTLHQHRNKASTVDSKLEQGERCWNFLKDTWGEERAEAYRCAVLYQAGIQTDAGPQLGLPANASSGSQPTPLHPKLPYTFWNSYMPTVLALRKNKSKHMECLRALKFFIERSSTGARSKVALRFTRKKGSFRNDKGSRNREFAPGLNFAVLQWFVDFVHRLRGRADSSIILSYARDVAAKMKLSGDAIRVPKLEGHAGVNWFARWRRRYKIPFCKTGMKLKVAWRKILRRVRVELSNIFRFRDCIIYWLAANNTSPLFFAARF